MFPGMPLGEDEVVLGEREVSSGRVEVIAAGSQERHLIAPADLAERMAQAHRERRPIQ